MECFFRDTHTGRASLLAPPEGFADIFVMAEALTAVDESHRWSPRKGGHALLRGTATVVRVVELESNTVGVASVQLTEDDAKAYKAVHTQNLSHVLSEDDFEQGVLLAAKMDAGVINLRSSWIKFSHNSDDSAYFYHNTATNDYSLAEPSEGVSSERQDLPPSAFMQGMEAALSAASMVAVAKLQRR